MDIPALIPIAAFLISFLAARQMVSSAMSRLNDTERLALFPVIRGRLLLMWLALPLVAGVYLAATLLTMALALSAIVIFLVGVEIFQHVRVRGLSIAAEFKRTHLIATAITCAGVLFAAAVMYVKVYAP